MLAGFWRLHRAVRSSEEACNVLRSEGGTRMGERHIQLGHEDLMCCSYILKATQHAKRLVVLLMDKENNEQIDGGNSKEKSVGYDVGAESTEKCLGEHILLVAKSLIFLLSSKKIAVSHMAAKSLLALSEHLINIGHLWMLLIELMWDAAKSWSCKLHTGHENVKTFTPMFEGSVVKDEDVFTFIKVMGHKGTVENRGTVYNASEVMFLFKRILKSCFAKRPCCSNGIQRFIEILEQNLMQVVTQTLSLQTDHFLNAKGLMLVASLQLLCSVARILASDWVKEGNDRNSFESLLKSLSNLLPMIAHDPLAQETGRRTVYSISALLRSKMLMLEVRLSVWFKSCTELATCSLLVLQSCARDLLKICLLHTKTSAIKFECFSSPFASCFANKVDLEMTENQLFFLEKHVYRRAIYLLIRTCHILLDETKEEEISSHSSIVVTEEATICASSQREEVSQRAGALFLGWMHIQLQPVWKIGNDGEFQLLEDSGSKLQNFILHLVDLYLDEDILLLEMLLLLLDFVELFGSLGRAAIFPLSAIGYIFEDSFSHYNELYNLAMEALAPLSVFHAFLASLQYNISLVVDYLISDSTAVLTLKYLLRCLHLVIQTWPSFLTSPSGRGSTVPKNLDNEQECSQNFGSSTMQYNRVEQTCNVLRNCSTTDSSAYSATKRKLGDLEETSACSRTIMDDAEDESVSDKMPQIFPEKAMECLLGLGERVERWHEKKLFPYSPAALVSRLKSVEELYRGN